MIFLMIEGNYKRQFLYVLDICFKILNSNYKIIDDISTLISPRDILITNKEKISYTPTIFVSEKKMLDLFEAISLKREVEKYTYDRFGRLCGKNLGREIENPKINEFAYFLKYEIEKQSSNKINSGKPIIFLTHDVDKITNKEIIVIVGKFFYLLKSIFSFKFKKSYKYLISLIISLFGKNTYWDFEEYIQLEDKFNVRSTFFFMLGKRGIRGSRYNIKNLIPIIKRLHNNGWEIGLHINYYHCNDVKEIIIEKENLEKIIEDKIIGARFHYLKFDPIHSFEILKKAGFKYDSTLGFHDRIGFRAGIAYAFNIYNLNYNCVENFIGIPLIIMDHALFEELELSKEEAWKKIKEVLDIFKNQNAIITILWHSGVLKDPIFQGWRDVYEQILNYIKENRLETMTGKEIYKKLCSFKNR